MISNTPHVLKVFTTPIMTFEDTPNKEKTTTLIGLQILSQAEFVVATSVEYVKEVIGQLVMKG